MQITKKVKACIVESYKLTRATYKFMLSGYNDIVILDDFEAMSECFKFLDTSAHCIDIVLISMDFNLLNILNAISKIKEEYPDIGIIATSNNVSLNEEIKARNAGANGYMYKFSDFDKIHDTILQIYESSILCNSIKDTNKITAEKFHFKEIFNKSFKRNNRIFFDKWLNIPLKTDI